MFFLCCADYNSVGCYRDTPNRAIYPLEGKDPILDGPYHLRSHAIAKCAVAAMRAGYSMFAVQNGGWCASSATAPQTYNKYGKSTACKADGEGGPWANQVYVMEGKATKSCCLYLRPPRVTKGFSSEEEIQMLHMYIFVAFTTKYRRKTEKRTLIEDRA